MATNLLQSWQSILRDNLNLFSAQESLLYCLGDWLDVVYQHIGQSSVVDAAVMALLCVVTSSRDPTPLNIDAATEAYINALQMLRQLLSKHTQPVALTQEPEGSYQFPDHPSHNATNTHSAALGGALIAMQLLNIFEVRNIPWPGKGGNGIHRMIVRLTRRLASFCTIEPYLGDTILAMLYSFPIFSSSTLNMQRVMKRISIFIIVNHSPT